MSQRYWIVVVTVATMGCRLHFDEVSMPASSFAGWSHRQALSIDPARLVDPVIDFPLLVDVVAPESVGRARDDGSDIAFFAADGLTRYGHELLRYDPADGHVRAWVALPAASPSTTFYLYFDHADPPPPPTAWGSFEASWHLDDDPRLQPPQISDATGRSPGTARGSWGAEQLVPGAVGGALRFIGARANAITVAARPGLEIGAGQDFTVEAWVRSTQLAEANRFPAILSKEDSIAPRQGYNLVLHKGTADARWYFETYAGGAGSVIHGMSDVADGAWHYLVGVRSGDTLAAYQDGAFAGSLEVTSSDLTRSTPIELGRLVETPNNYLTGAIDEVRISRTARSRAWIRAVHANLIAPVGFVELGAFE